MNRRPGGTTTLIVGLALALLLGACWGGDDDDGQSGSGGPAGGDDTGPFTVRLSAGEPVRSSVRTTPVVDGDALDADAMAAITGRLPEFEGADGDRVAYNRPAETRPRPRVGETVDVPFGVPEDQPPRDVASGPVEVLRHQPIGDVDVAPFISVTFDRPMVPLGTLDQLEAVDVPVRVTPELDGRWRWIGTRTLRFEHADDSIDRLPAATEYTVDIPAGTAAAGGSEDGGALAEAFTWSFTTPPPRMVSVAPEGDVIDLAPVFVVTFDQRIDPEAVIDAITLTVDGEPRSIRLATEDEIAGDEAAQERIENELDGRWLAFRTEDPMPAGAAVEIVVGPGTPSAEGPRQTTEAATHRTRTREPFRVTGTECGWDSGCRTGMPLIVELNNPVDPESFDPGAVEVRPAIGGSIGVHGNTIVLQGDTQANTSYEVELPTNLRDTFGQELGDANVATFEVGDAAPMLRPFPGWVVTTDPYAEAPRVSVTSVGHETLKVSLYTVDPGDHDDFQRFIRRWDQEDLSGLPQWRRVSSTTVEVPGGADRLTETSVDLSDALDGEHGHVVVAVEPTRTFDRDTDDHWNNLPTLAWVQATSIGLDAVADHHDLVAWATDLRDGEPIEGVAVRMDGAEVATTGNDGLATLPLAGDAEFLVATKGDDSAILTAQHHGSWSSFPLQDAARWFVVDDRQLYRPGEQAHVKGWVRRLTLTEEARIRPVGGDPSVRYVVRDSFGNEMAGGTTGLTGTGGFDFTVEIPAGASIGPAYVELSLEGTGAGDAIGESSYAHQFQIEEFRRPEFEVVTTAESPEPHLMTAPVTVAAVAQYFAGGVLPGAPVTWQVTTQKTTYSPPNWSDFTFGVWKPFWQHEGDIGLMGPGRFAPGGDIGPCCGPTEQEQNSYQGETDTTGSDHLQLDFEGEKPDEPITVSANAAVEDVNRQSFGSTVDLLVHPSSLYVGVRSARTFVRQGDGLDVELVVTDIDGAAVAGRDISVTAARVQERFQDGEWTEVDIDAQECTVTSGDEPVTCDFDTDTGGRYRIRATVTDDEGGRNRSELTRWVSGADAVPARGVEQESVTIIPAEEEYEPGDTAELLVVAPFDSAHGLLTIARNGIEATRVLDIEGGSTVVEIPITDAEIPGIDVQVDLAGAAPRTRDDGTTDDDLPPRPAFATGSVHLAVPATTKTLDITATPQDPTLEPGGTTSVSVAVDGPGGSPVAGAEVAVVVVDEAVLSLIGYELPDPIAAIYQPLMTSLRAEHSRNSLVLERPDVFGADPAPSTTVAAPAPQDGFEESADDSAQAADGDAAGGATASRSAELLSGSGTSGSVQTPIDIRTDFDALAVFEPAVPTGEDGTAVVEVTVPDNLTRYRVMAFAADDADRFGSGESTITARLPLMVRPSPPRFVNFGDRFEFPVVLQNQTDDAMEVDVVIEAANLSLTGAAGKAVTVPARERVEVRFPVAAEDAGTARYRVTAVSAGHADSADGELPAYTPTTTVAFATYGVVDEGAVAQPLLTPTGVVPQFGGLEVDTSSTALQALTDAVIYLAEYPYESADAYASRITALVSLRDVFAAFATATSPTPEELDATIRSDLDALVRLQNDDGGFSGWQRGRPSEPYGSIQATHALVAAEAAGYPVNADARARALEFAATIEDHFPRGWTPAARNVVVAYALFVRDLAGDRDAGGAADLYRSDPDLPLDALAWLWPVVDDAAISGAIETTFANRLTETPAGATFATDLDETDEALVLASDRRTDGIILDALIRLRPDSDLIPKVVAGLVGNQVKGRWSNIQENGFILLAMKRYFDTFEAVEPAFVARTWLGDTYAAEHQHQGRSIDTTRTLIPMSELDGDPDVVVAKDGAGRLYYRLGLRYAPEDLSLDPRDEGFVVARTYEAVGDADDVRRRDDGSWQIEPGAMVRVRVTMVADSARTNMALVDPLPAGLEIANPALAASPRPPQEDTDPNEPATWHGWTWFDHQQARDDRAEAFSAYLPAGTYDYTYVARATTPGTFVTPPAKAEEIYRPEVFGRSSTDTVVIAPT